VNVLATSALIYKNGTYFEKNPLWHAEHSAWKAAQIVKMIRRAKLTPKTICEVGCGAGGVLRHIQANVDSECHLQGFDISPYAINLCGPRANERLRFTLIEGEDDIPGPFDLLVSIDVVEHVEDYLGHLRRLRPKALFKIFHVPLDLSVQSVLRGRGLTNRRDSHAHLHYFTKETFLRSLSDVGYEVQHAFYTRRSIEIGSGCRQRLVALPRRLAFKVDQDIAARVFGGFSLAVLAT